MTRKEFKEQFGEYPEEILGKNWKDEIYAYEDWSIKELTKEI